MKWEQMKRNLILEGHDRVTLRLEEVDDIYDEGYGPARELRQELAGAEETIEDLQATIATLEKALAKPKT